VTLLNFSAIISGIYPCIIANFLRPPGLRRVSRTSLETFAPSCMESIFGVISVVILVIWLSISFFFLVSSVILVRTCSYADLGFCGRFAGITNG
jgi:hypothetical protein